ncbi:Rop family plasmid primer RNA-binding protein [Escherichia coli]|uniref:Rop family plasmid primer RNA-binding protein n=1 Tax=Enterobacteriaceae TaxID=543 RepID=UPI0010CB3321|nr:Rop family plasmid primer RNA-binding protein [Escherichia coli]EBW1866792.1 Rop family plasmid primer RNA-binding protein [Salmonella enterica subsp. enterica serovar Mbandaka]ECD5229805.1 Rop family plasmid primer RNA-binding protein [Salmonella enterica subsp. enterica serovar Braenderup]EHL2708231.1 Rop family plasmid primer RNA-binding protein [Escherichia coli]EHN3656952.1 Rop family plasmid primer RNA-binding protein [Escherichia coli]EJA9027112.1 Rop family plasmid primer RNA-bindin
MAKPTPAESAMNVTRFIRTQSLIMLEKVEALDFDDLTALAEKLHDDAEYLELLVTKRVRNP